MGKSSTCIGKNGPLAEFDSEYEAQSFLDQKGINHLIPYECKKCKMWHLSPEDRHTPSTPCEWCNKALYKSEKDARQRAAILRKDQKVALRVYQCPHGDGWHLTKRDTWEDGW